MPVIFVTVEEALGDLAGLKKGERVLIHAAAGGVGLVAIQYAQWVGAEVLATAGSEDKHAFLRNLGVKRITSTRDGAKFEEEMKKFLKEDGIDGVDVVLNSLSHDDYIPRSLAVLKKGGRFMEIGKRGIWSHEEMYKARPDVMYEKIASDTMMEKECWRYNAYLSRLLGRAAEGALTPINIHSFAGLEKGVSAMQFLQRANNIGKVVISEPSRMLCKPDGLAVLSGGMGALGIVTAQFMVEEGSKSLFLLSRSGTPAKDALVQFEWLKACAVSVSVEKCDVSSESSVKALQKSLTSPVDVLLHLAGVLADGMLPTLSREHFEKSYAPKVHGLHHMCKHWKLSEDAAYLLFSSTSALFGSPGQANYSASNSVLDAIAPSWSAQGRRTWSVQWGPWAEVGMAVQANTLGRAKAMGVGALTTAVGMAIMGSILGSTDRVVGAVPVRWAKHLRSTYPVTPKFLDDMEEEVRRAAPAAGEGGGGGTIALANLSAEERLEAVRNGIRDMAREVVDNNDLALDAALLESGMDSLSGVEFRNRLVTEFEGVRMPNSLIFDHPTVSDLALFISDQLADTLPSGGAAPALAAASPAEAEAPSSAMIEALNQRTVGAPIFLVPGAGMQAGGFRALASLLPVPAFGLSWPKGTRPRAEWPTTLTELAKVFFEEVRKAQPSGPYRFAGHSFGAAVALAMAKVAEEAGAEVSLVALLDPRHLGGEGAGDIGTAFAGTGLADSLALLSQTVPDGSKYAQALEEISKADAADRDAMARKVLSPAVLASLEHVHETTKWYSTLLSGEMSEGQLQARVTVLRAAETWHAAAASESVAEKMVREFQAQTFQGDDKVAARVAAWCGAKGGSVMKVPGTHFSMLHEPAVVTVALRLCRAVDEAEEDA